MRLRASTRDWWLAALGHLGRWSLVDIYFTLLLLLLLSKAELDLPVLGLVVAAGGKAEAGLYVFHAAIISSMVAVQILQKLNATLQPARSHTNVGSHARHRPLLFDAGWRGACVLGCVY